MSKRRRTEDGSAVAPNGAVECARCTNAAARLCGTCSAALCLECAQCVVLYHKEGGAYHYFRTKLCGECAEAKRHPPLVQYRVPQHGAACSVQ